MREILYSFPVAVHLVRHPVAQDALLGLRSASTCPSRFRRLARRLGTILAIEATRDLATSRAHVDGPLERADGDVLQGEIVAVPVLRAGLGLLESVLDVLPEARVGHIGLARDECTAVAAQYYARLPAIDARTAVLLIDPMIATGGSAAAAARIVRDAGARDVRFLSIVSVPEGLARLEDACPDVRVYTAAIDRELDTQKYIRPGLGDFGDRLYGT